MNYPSRPNLSRTTDPGEPGTGEIPVFKEKLVRTGSENDGRSSSANLLSPASYVSPEISRSAAKPTEKRRGSWMGGRYKLFSMKTDDLLENTPGKLKQFFHRVLRIQSHKHQMHVTPAKTKKSRETSKKRSMSELKSFSAKEELVVLDIGDHKRASFSGVIHCDSSAQTSAHVSELSLPSPRSDEASLSGSESLSPRSISRASFCSDSHSGNPASSTSHDHSQSPTSFNSDDEVADLVDGCLSLRRHSTEEPPPTEELVAARDKRSLSYAEGVRSSHPSHVSPAMANTRGTKAKGRKSPFSFLKRGTKHKGTE